MLNVLHVVCMFVALCVKLSYKKNDNNLSVCTGCV